MGSLRAARLFALAVVCAGCAVAARGPRALAQSPVAPSPSAQPQGTQSRPAHSPGAQAPAGRSPTAPPPGPRSPAAGVAASRAPKTLSLSTFDADPATAELVRLLSLGSAMEARAGSDAHEPTATPEQRGRILWLGAKAAELIHDEAGAAARLKALVALDHPLAAPARAWLARLLVESDPRGAREVLAPLLASEGRTRALRVLSARADLRAGDTARGVATLRELLGRASADFAAVDVAMPLANELASHRAAADREEAVHLYRRIALRLPGTEAATDAEKRIKDVLAKLPPAARARAKRLTPADWRTLADALAKARRYKDAEKAYRTAAKLGDTAARCEAEYDAARMVFQRRERHAAAPLFLRLSKRCKAADVRGRALYMAGRSYGLIGNFREALRLYDELLRAHPAHELADDAVLRGALALRELKAPEADALARLERLIREYPSSDTAGETRFRLAWAAFRAGTHATAAARFGELAERGDTLAEDAYGRASYWRARSVEALGRKEEAALAYQTIATSWPLAYYAQLSLVRLAALDASKAAALEASWRGSPAPLSLPWRAEFESPAFQRARELLRVQETAAAFDELAALAPGEDDDAWLWATAAIAVHVGEPSRAVNALRRKQRRYRGTAPIGEAHGRWRLAYPKAFAPLIDEVAASNDVPSAFVRAIAREESSFTPGAVSPAQAYGVIQVILPTARRWGAELGLTVTPATLKDPAVNIPVGVRFMRYLWERYSANPAVVPAAYNAGNAAVDRWLAERGALPFDEWVEEIPYDETQRYTRRVLQSYGVYAWLDGGKPLPLGLPLPPAPP